MACTLTRYGAANCPTVASPSVSRATRSRLVGSARAANTCDSGSLISAPNLNYLVDETLCSHPANVNQMVDQN